MRTAGQGTYRIDGSLRDIVTAPRWRFVGMDGDFCCLRPVGRPRSRLGRRRSGVTARVVSDTPWGTETIRVDATARRSSIRSVQFSTGWQATVTSGRGPARSTSGPEQRTAPVGGRSRRGRHRPFVYRPSRALLGIGLSAAGVLLAILLAGWPLLAPSPSCRLSRGPPSSTGLESVFELGPQWPFV